MEMMMRAAFWSISHLVVRPILYPDWIICENMFLIDFFSPCVCEYRSDNKVGAEFTGVVSCLVHPAAQVVSVVGVAVWCRGK